MGKDNNVYVGGFECLEYSFQEYNWYLKKFSPAEGEMDLGGAWMYTDDSLTETRVYTINGKDLAFDNVYSSHGYEHIVDILIDDLTDMVYLVGRSDEGFSIRAMHDE